MKIGILTFHLGLNHGGFLQAYCLQTFIQQHGYDVVIINYKNRKHFLKQDLRPWFILQRPSTLINHIRKRLVFTIDQHRMMKTNFTTSPDRVRKMYFDRVLVGSDIVWSQDLFGFDPVYFGDVHCEKLIAYAPSFGWMPPESQLEEPVVQGLRKFNRFMVRDANAVEIIRNHLGVTPDLVLDPTLLDFQKPFGLPVDETSNVMLVYAYKMDEIWKNSLMAYADQYDLRIEMIGYDVGIPGARYVNVGPFEWINRFKISRVCVTNTFHGSIYALMSGHPFVSIIDLRSVDKIKSLFGQLNCTERLCAEPSSLEELLSSPPGQSCFRLLKNLSSKSGELLLDAVK